MQCKRNFQICTKGAPVHLGKDHKLRNDDMLKPMWKKMTRRVIRIKIKPHGAWKKNTGCSARGPRFNSQLTQHLIAVYNFNSRGSNTLIKTYMQAKHQCTKNKLKIF